MKQKNALLVAVAIICGIIVAVLVARGGGKNQEPPGVDVVMVKGTLNIGTILADGDLKPADQGGKLWIEKVPRAMAAEDAPPEIATLRPPENLDTDEKKAAWLKENLKGRRIQKALKTGSILTVADYSFPATAFLREDRGTLSIGTTALQANAGFIVPGDRVDVIYKGPGTGGTIAVTLQPNMLVVAVDLQDTVPGAGQRAIPQIGSLTFQVTNYQRKILKLASGRGELTFSRVKNLQNPDELKKYNDATSKKEDEEEKIDRRRTLDLRIVPESVRREYEELDKQLEQLKPDATNSSQPTILEIKKKQAALLELYDNPLSRLPGVDLEDQGEDEDTQVASVKPSRLPIGTVVDGVTVDQYFEGFALPKDRIPPGVVTIGDIKKKYKSEKRYLAREMAQGEFLMTQHLVAEEPKDTSIALVVAKNPLKAGAVIEAANIKDNFTSITVPKGSMPEGTVTMAELEGLMTRKFLKQDLLAGQTLVQQLLTDKIDAPMKEVAYVLFAKKEIGFKTELTADNVTDLFEPQEFPKELAPRLALQFKDYADMKDALRGKACLRALSPGEMLLPGFIGEVGKTEVPIVPGQTLPRWFFRQAVRNGVEGRAVVRWYMIDKDPAGNEVPNYTLLEDSSDIVKNYLKGSEDLPQPIKRMVDTKYLKKGGSGVSEPSGKSPKDDLESISPKKADVNKSGISG